MADPKCQKCNGLGRVHYRLMRQWNWTEAPCDLCGNKNEPTMTVPGTRSGPGQKPGRPSRIHWRPAGEEK